MNISLASLMHSKLIRNGIKVDYRSVAEINFYDCKICSHDIVPVSHDVLCSWTRWGSPRWEDNQKCLRWGVKELTLQNLNVLFESPNIDSTFDIYEMSSHVDWVNGSKRYPCNKDCYQPRSPYLVDSMQYMTDPYKICYEFFN